MLQCCIKKSLILKFPIFFLFSFLFILESLSFVGNIRVYCRIRPFLPGQSQKQTTIEYIGENGELLVVNPSKQGKDGRRMFKFNKVFGPAASQGFLLYLSVSILDVFYVEIAIHVLTFIRKFSLSPFLLIHSTNETNTKPLSC